MSSGAAGRLYMETQPWRPPNDASHQPAGVRALRRVLRHVEVEHPDVQRIKRAHVNAIENAVPFFVIGFIYTQTSPSMMMARVLFLTFVAIRLFHAIFYLTAKQPFRTLRSRSAPSSTWRWWCRSCAPFCSSRGCETMRRCARRSIARRSSRCFAGASRSATRRSRPSRRCSSRAASTPRRFCCRGRARRMVSLRHAGPGARALHRRSGQEHTRTFIAEGQVTGSLLDLLSGEPSVTWIQALEPTETLAWRYRDFDALCARVPELHVVARRSAEALYVRKTRREHEMLALPARGALRAVGSTRARRARRARQPATPGVVSRRDARAPEPAARASAPKRDATRSTAPRRSK